MNIVGILLAGGLSRRMGGGDKNRLLLNGKPILTHVIDRVRPQVSSLVLNANGDPERFAQFGLPVAADVVDGHAGPLAGILTGMDWAARNVPACRWIATFPTDAPFLPTDLVEKLFAELSRQDAELACAVSDGRTHPPIAVWSVGLREALRTAMLEEDMRKIDRWTARHDIVHVEFDAAGVDPFFNVNKPENLEEAERYVAGLEGAA